MLPCAQDNKEARGGLEIIQLITGMFIMLGIFRDLIYSKDALESSLLL